MSELLHEGDPPPHRHDAPRVPRGHHGEPTRNAVVRCRTCGRLLVSRWDGDPWSSGWWIPLRWWHRRARRALATGLTL